MRKDSEKVLIEETYLPENSKLLGGKTTSTLANGTILKAIRVPFCDVCGVMLEEVALCSSCQKKLCPSCTIKHENKVYCRECAKRIVPLTKRQFIVLLGIANEIALKEIKEFSRIYSHDLREDLAALLERGLLERKGVSVFSRYSITNEGLSVLPTAEQIYQNEGDVQHFLSKIKELSSKR